MLFTFTGVGPQGTHWPTRNRAISGLTVVQKGLEMPRGPRPPLMPGMMHTAEARGDFLQTSPPTPQCAISPDMVFFGTSP